jgi:Spy/CpxP family protein refolding chaperone
MKRFILWSLLALSLSANLAVAAVAIWQRRAPPPGEPRIFSQVSLDADQRARIEGLRAALLSTREAHVRRIGQLRHQLGAAIARQPEDRAGIERALHEIAEVQAAYQEAVVMHVLAVRDVLRPDQRPAFENMLAERIGGGMALGPGAGGAPLDCQNCPAPGNSR